MSFSVLMCAITDHSFEQKLGLFQDNVATSHCIPRRSDVIIVLRVVYVSFLFYTRTHTNTHAHAHTHPMNVYQRIQQSLFFTYINLRFQNFRDLEPKALSYFLLSLRSHFLPAKLLLLMVSADQGTESQMYYKTVY